MAEAPAPRPRLLVLSSTYPRWPGDPEPAFVHELARRLVPEFDVHVLSPHAAGAQRIEQLDGVHVRRFRYAPASLERLVNDGGIVGNLRRRPWLWLVVPLLLSAQVLATLRALRRVRPDVVHAHWLVPQGAVFALLGMLGCRLPAWLVTSHGADLFSLRKLDRLKRAVASRATRMSVVSRAMRELAGDMGIPATKIDVMPMGVDLESRFTPSPDVARSSSELLFVGRLVEKKGLALLVGAMPAVLLAFPAATLTIVGFGPEEGRLRSQVAALGLGSAVSFLGAVPQRALPDLYRRAALFVAPFVRAASGDQEGLGLVTVEALGCGCPVLVGDVPAAHDVVQEGCGLIVDATDTAALAAAVTRLLSDPQLRESLARQGRAMARDRFDWQAVAEGYSRLLTGLSGSRRIPRAAEETRA